MKTLLFVLLLGSIVFDHSEALLRGSTQAEIVVTDALVNELYTERDAEPWPFDKREPLENVALDSTLGNTMFAKLLSPQNEGDASESRNAMVLLRYLETQMNLGACAPASAVTVLNAMNYKRPYDPIYTPYLGEGYRFWTQNAFIYDACVKKILGGHVFGETLADFGAVMKCLGLHVDVKHGDGSEDFSNAMREHLSAGHFVIANFDRALVHEKAGGHFSPVGGYTDGYFLVLDVARYKYPPVFIPAADLVQGMTKKDEQSGMARGFVALWS